MRALGRLGAMRARTEARMLDTWAIGTNLGYTYDAAQDADVQTVTPLFTTKGRLKAATRLGTDADAGERTIVSTMRELHIPTGSPKVPGNAVAQCIAIGKDTDPSVLGTIVRLGGQAPGSQTTARRLHVTEVLT